MDLGGFLRKEIDLILNGKVRAKQARKVASGMPGEGAEHSTYKKEIGPFVPH